MNDDASTEPQPSPEIIGGSPVMVRLRAQVARLLSRQIAGGCLPPILIEGETGTGKGLMARAIHRCSMRSAEPFIDVDCAAFLRLCWRLSCSDTSGAPSRTLARTSRGCSAR